MTLQETACCHLVKSYTSMLSLTAANLAFCACSRSFFGGISQLGRIHFYTRALPLSRGSSQQSGITVPCHAQRRQCIFRYKLYQYKTHTLPTYGFLAISSCSFYYIKWWLFPSAVASWDGVMHRISPSRRGDLFRPSRPKGLTYGDSFLGHMNGRNPFGPPDFCKK